MTELGEIVVEVCQDCGKDNWQHHLLEVKVKDNSLWLCLHCYADLVKMLIEKSNLTIDDFKKIKGCDSEKENEQR